MELWVLDWSENEEYEHYEGISGVFSSQQKAKDAAPAGLKWKKPATGKHVTTITATDQENNVIWTIYSTELDVFDWPWFLHKDKEG